MSLDPTVDEIKKLCTSLRRNAKVIMSCLLYSLKLNCIIFIVICNTVFCYSFDQEERVLFHYNGHGVPRPTANGEIWVFNKVLGSE